MEKRLYRAEMGPTWKCPGKSCLFCEHCTDMWWDYSHGPYMFACEIDEDTEEGYKGTCKKFVDSGYVYTEPEPITEEDRLEIEKFWEEHGEEFWNKFVEKFGVVMTAGDWDIIHEIEKETENEKKFI